MGSGRQAPPSAWESVHRTLFQVGLGLSAPRSTSICRLKDSVALFSNLTPVLLAPADWSHKPLGAYSAESVDEISGNFIVTAISTFPTLISSIPKEIFGCEKAASPMEAESLVTPKVGVRDEPSQPVAELSLGLLISATTLALLGRLAESPNDAAAEPAMLALTPTS